jgi:asparagine synthase (glutamine-hydrolysing)
MSAFFGILHFDSAPVSLVLANRLLDRIRYRGSDAQQVWQQGSLTLSHVLDQIVTDTIEEHQPFTSENVTVVADAFLSNRTELITRLKKTDVGASRTLERVPDCELIHCAYLAWGEDCFQALTGKFSIAIWDARTGSLVLAVDPMAQSPLFYTHTANSFIFSTELGVLRLHPEFDQTLDEKSIASFLAFGTYKRYDKSLTIFQHIYQIQPAHRVCLSTTNPSYASSITQTRYWSLPVDGPMLRYKTIQEYVEHFRELLYEVVRSYIRAEQIVVSMSGGMDSTSLAAVVQQIQQREARPASTTAVSAVYYKTHLNNDGYYATLTANKLRMPIDYIHADDYPIADPLPALAAPGTAFQRGLFEKTNETWLKYGKLVFIGDGSDEMFFQTPLIQVLARLPLTEAIKLYRWLWQLTKQRPSLYGRPMLQQAFRLLRAKRRTSAGFDPQKEGYPVWINPEFEAAVNLQAMWKDYWNVVPPVIHPYHPDAYNFIMEGSWGNTVEFVQSHNFIDACRVSPLLDTRLLNFAFSLPPQLSARPKFLLRQAMIDLLPLEVIRRPKEPLGFLLDNLLRLPGSEWIDSWQPVPQLERYVRRDAIPSVQTRDISFKAKYLQQINIRPLLLNAWLKALNEHQQPN